MAKDAKKHCGFYYMLRVIVILCDRIMMHSLRVFQLGNELSIRKSKSIRQTVIKTYNVYSSSFNILKQCKLGIKTDTNITFRWMLYVCTSTCTSGDDTVWIYLKCWTSFQFNNKNNEIQSTKSNETHVRCSAHIDKHHCHNDVGMFEMCFILYAYLIKIKTK